jgi:hypothetical protein
MTTVSALGFHANEEFLYLDGSFMTNTFTIEIRLLRQ